MQEHNRTRPRIELAVCSKTDSGVSNPWRPILLACTVFLLAGYCLYLMAVIFPAPSWALMVIEWSTPTVRALHSAANVAELRGQSPFPAQVVILYCAWGSIVLTAWCVYHCFFTRPLRESWFRHAERRAIEQKFTRAKLITVGLITTSIWLFYPTVLFIHSPSSTSWQATNFFSPSFGSITFLLLAGYVNVIAVLGLLPLYFGLTNRLAKLHTKD